MYKDSSSSGEVNRVDNSKNPENIEVIEIPTEIHLPPNKNNE